ncbi:MAG: hypothetical protein L6Q95_16025 [Planctomycetes bacterium]|nr:hypothetical protein [Planctomycetota bacterium]
MFREGLRPPDPFRERPPLEAACTQEGISLKTLSAMSPVLLLLLPEVRGRRGQGMLRALAAVRGEIERAGVRVVLVHYDEAGDLAPFDLAYVARVHDPERRLYAHFGLGTAPKGLLRREAQEAGAFLLRAGEVVREGRGDAPDYRGIAGI